MEAILAEILCMGFDKFNMLLLADITQCILPKNSGSNEILLSLIALFLLSLSAKGSRRRLLLLFHKLRINSIIESDVYRKSGLDDDAVKLMSSKKTAPILGHRSSAKVVNDCLRDAAMCLKSLLDDSL